jgi:hypothetical protein
MSCGLWALTMLAKLNPGLTTVMIKPTYPRQTTCRKKAQSGARKGEDHFANFSVVSLVSATPLLTHHFTAKICLIRFVDSRLTTTLLTSPTLAEAVGYVDSGRIVRI